jgi:uncharacterized membrane protein
VIASAPRHDRLTHRLEAFSDIVIGFSLGQLALNLVIPPHAIDFIQRPLAITAFLVTFLLVARFWWLHFVIFEHYFVPTRAMIVCNFIALAAMILQIFSLQLYSHFVPLAEGVVAGRIYFGFFVLSYGMLCIMQAIGLRTRWTMLSINRRRAGVQSGLRILGTIVGAAIGDLVSTDASSTLFIPVNQHQEIVSTWPTAILVGTVIGSIAGLVAARLAPVIFPGLRVDSGLSVPVPSAE